MNKRKISKSILIMAEALLLCVVIIFSLLSMTVNGGGSASNGDKPQISGGRESENDFHESEADGDYVEVRLDFSKEVEEKIASMTTEEMVAQLFILCAEDLPGVDEDLSEADIESALKQYPVGGLVYDQDNLSEEEETFPSIGKVQKVCKEGIGLPLFIAIEEEGGIDRSPFAIKNSHHITMSPGELSAFGDTDMVEEEVSARMEYLTQNNFNMVFGAMANLAKGEDAYMDDRMYGSDSEIAASFISADVKATNAYDVVGVLRYFPRQQDAGVFDEITDEELSVFRAGIEAGAKAIMVGHSKAEELTGDANLPCSLATGTVIYLREEMGHTGLLITASFEDEEIVGNYDSGEAAVIAIAAGMDMIYEPADFTESYEVVLAAVKDGTISKIRLENSVGRILENKME